MTLAILHQLDSSVYTSLLSSRRDLFLAWIDYSSHVSHRLCPYISYLPLMTYFALFCIAFGSIVILYPQFLAYLIGFFFIFIGLNTLFFSMAFMKRNNPNSEKKWAF